MWCISCLNKCRNTLSQVPTKPKTDWSFPWAILNCWKYKTCSLSLHQDVIGHHYTDQHWFKFAPELDLTIIATHETCLICIAHHYVWIESWSKEACTYNHCTIASSPSDSIGWVCLAPLACFPAKWHQVCNHSHGFEFIVSSCILIYPKPPASCTGKKNWALTSALTAECSKEFNPTS